MSEQLQKVLDAPALHAEIRAELDAEFKWLTTYLREQVFPVLDATAEAVRSLTTLSAGAVVASVSVIQILGEHNAPTTADFLLKVSWVMFALTILLSVIRGGG